MEGVVISPVNIKERTALNISAGDTVRVWQKIEEKGKTRLQAFEGLVLATKHGSEPGGTFTVRKVSGGVGVEKIFPIYSPMIDKIEVIRRVKVRRSKLYYIREKVAREARRALRRMKLVNESTQSETEVEAQRIAAEEAAAKAAEEAAAAEEAKKAEEAAKEAAAETPAAEEAPAEEAEVEETPAEGGKEQKSE